ncbi:DNA repair protein Sae2/CtIP [Macleaya cordata]|uniref:DNA repair protein Sae2/CtIP n=1 Tax=Macleaya cordata TaxID=56857 RepID=A0A200R601_MACCD|nr:DNA repair protein Sae2/CtIP [Macleaya cordata]
MEGNLETSPQLGNSVDNDDVNSFSGLSTILVATIQEVKDRMSQIEYIFCSQLFPSFQARSKSLHKRYVAARRAAEDDWREKESCFLRKIEELRLEKIQTLEENRLLVASLDLERTKLLKNETLKAKEGEWRKEENSLLLQIDEIKLEHQKTLEENRQLVSSLKHEKTNIMNNEQLLNELETEKKLLMAKLESLEKKNEEVAELQGQLKQMTEEVAEQKRLHEKLLHQIELKDYEMMLEKKKNRNVVDSFKRLKSQYNFLRNKFGLNTENQSNWMEDKSNSSRLGQNPRISNGPEDRDQETSMLASKTNEQMDEISLHRKLDDNKGARLIQNSSSHSPIKSPSTSSSSRPIKCPIGMKSEPLSGIKQPISYWRDTRSRQEPGGADPHDDFLDTPLENIKENLTKGLKEEPHDLPVPPPKDMDLDSSDDETQDLNGEPAPRKEHISITRPEDRVFKYVEPVRKKAERENLKGIECSQCKKFYDAVLPDGGKNNDNNNNNNSNFRCEHHDGVSRHRYRFLPPSTPEGFWNIGFDSEL